MPASRSCGCHLSEIGSRKHAHSLMGEVGYCAALNLLIFWFCTSQTPPPRVIPEVFMFFWCACTEYSFARRKCFHGASSQPPPLYSVFLLSSQGENNRRYLEERLKNSIPLHLSVHNLSAFWSWGMPALTVTKGLIMVCWWRWWW